MDYLRIKPKLQPRIVKEQKGGKYLYLDPEKPDWVVTNRNGATALSLCNGKLSIAQIARKISKSARENLNDQVINYLGDIYKNKSILKPFSASNTFHYPLRILQLSLTRECNLKCIYCYAASRIQTSRQDYLTKKELKALVDEVNKVSKNVGVVLTGGEPLLSKHCLSLGKYAADSGNYPHLLTNGLLVTRGNVQNIAEIFSLVKISIDGCDSEHHDFHRGKGTLKKVLNAIELLDSFNANISISMTVTQRNINHIDKMVSKFGKRLSFQPLFSAGRAKSEKLGITGNEYYKALSSVKGVSPLSRLALRLNNARKSGVYKCAIGDAEISISETGDVYPCQLLHVPEFLAGNIRNNSLQEIYKTSAILNKCRHLHINRIKGCKQCSVRLICGGACRARAFHEKGRIDVSGDFCEYEKKAIMNGIFDSYEI